MPLGMEVGIGPGHIVLDGDPARTQQPPTFRPMSIVPKRSPISATAELLLLYLPVQLTEINNFTYSSITINISLIVMAYFFRLKAMLTSSMGFLSDFYGNYSSETYH